MRIHGPIFMAAFVFLLLASFGSGLLYSIASHILPYNLLIDAVAIVAVVYFGGLLMASAIQPTGKEANYGATGKTS